MTATQETAPARWAPYLINGDDTGIDTADRAAAHQWLCAVGGAVVDCGDTYIARFNGLIDEVTDYTILIDEES